MNKKAKVVRKKHKKAVERVKRKTREATAASKKRGVKKKAEA